MNETDVCRLEHLIELAQCVATAKWSKDREVSDANEAILDYVKGMFRRIKSETETEIKELIEEIESLEGYADEYRMDGGASEEEKNQQRADRRAKYLQ